MGAVAAVDRCERVLRRDPLREIGGRDLDRSGISRGRSLRPLNEKELKKENELKEKEKYSQINQFALPPPDLIGKRRTQNLELFSRPENAGLFGYTIGKAAESIVMTNKVTILNRCYEVPKGSMLYNLAKNLFKHIDTIFSNYGIAISYEEESIPNIGKKYIYENYDEIVTAVEKFEEIYVQFLRC